jgi:hypothetical protein
MSLLPRRSITAALAIAAVGLAGAAPTTFARQGADDPPSHDIGDDHGGRKVRANRADDRGRQHRHGGAHHRRGGHDDGPNHR